MTTPYKKALKNGDKYYSTGKPCKHGHIAKRDTASGHCIICESNRNRSIENANRYQLNREKIWVSGLACGYSNNGLHLHI